MRSIILGASLVALTFAVGCNLAPHQRNSVGGGAAVNTASPTVENLVEYLNLNAARIRPDQAIVSQNVNILGESEAGRIGVDCKMICQAPRNLLMSGVVLGSPAVDIGSNEKEFWFWSREMKPAYLYHCSYAAMEQGVQVPFPFQPDMAVTALGLAQYDRTKKYDLRTADDRKRRLRTYELTEQAFSPDHKPIKKVTVFNANAVTNVSQPQVLEHILKDDHDRVICVATVRSAQRVGGSDGPIIPKMVDFSWPDQKLKMTMTIYNPSIIELPPDKAALKFTRQNDQRPSFDLATQKLDNGGLERAGATAPPVYRP